jgi:hypothetical protein
MGLQPSSHRHPPPPGMRPCLDMSHMRFCSVFLCVLWKSYSTVPQYIARNVALDEYNLYTDFEWVADLSRLSNNGCWLTKVTMLCGGGGTTNWWQIQVTLDLCPHHGSRCYLTTHCKCQTSGQRIQESTGVRLFGQNHGDPSSRFMPLRFYVSRNKVWFQLHAKYQSYCRNMDNSQICLRTYGTDSK